MILHNQRRIPVYSIHLRILSKSAIRRKGNLKYTLVYVPEGAKPDDNTSDMFDTTETIADDDFSDSLIDVYTQIVQDVSKTTTVKKFTSAVKGRNEILDKYANGEIEVLTSMKCLDEGVDVPRSELAVFCASTGNPRQFIQSRGRILRNHPDKEDAIRRIRKRRQTRSARILIGMHPHIPGRTHPHNPSSYGD